MSRKKVARKRHKNNTKLRSGSLHLVDLTGMVRTIRIEADALASGGDGAIYRLKDDPGLLAKLYHEPEKDPDRLNKVQAMLADPPDLPDVEMNGRRYIQIAWPRGWIEEEGRFVGYVMPVVDLAHATPLENFLARKTRALAGLPESYGYRLNAAANLAAVVAELHAHRHHIIDLKPVNLNVYTDTFLMAVLDCDGFSVHGQNQRYPAHQFSDGYICPEALQQSLPPQALGEDQDRFALAVIIFQLLNRGLHPYQGVPVKGQKVPTSNSERIQYELYAYGAIAHTKLRPSPWSIHEFLEDETRALFDRAFSTQYDRPRAQEWHQHLKEFADLRSGKVYVCTRNREHIHFSKGCPWCELENRSRKKVSRRAANPSSTGSVSPPPATVAGGSVRRSYLGYGFVALLAIIFFYVLASAPKDTDTTETAAQVHAQPVPEPQTEPVVSCDEIAPEVPDVHLAYEVVQLKLSWPAVRCATHYRVLSKHDESSDFVQLGEEAASTEKTVDIAFDQHWDRTVYRVQACNSVGCATSGDVTMTLEGVEPVLGIYGLDSAWNALGSAIGFSVARSRDGNTLALGVPTRGMGTGAVLIYTREDGLWTRQDQILSGSRDIGQLFGDAVALSDDGNTLVVGAPLASKSGLVYVFVRNGEKWTKQGQLSASNARKVPAGAMKYMGEMFGSSVALSGDGDTLAVGARQEDGLSKGVEGDASDISDDWDNDSGAVYVFTRRGGTWAQQAYVKASNAEASDGFGQAVALSRDGKILAVGANGEDSGTTGFNGSQSDNSAEGAGAAYVFTRNSDAAWYQQAYVKPSPGEVRAQFGTSVDLSDDGNTLAVGAYKAAKQGGAYVFVRDNGVWSQDVHLASFGQDSGDRFGADVSLSGDGKILTVGSYLEDDEAWGMRSEASAAFVYVRNDTRWRREAYIKSSTKTQTVTISSAPEVNRESRNYSSNSAKPSSKTQESSSSPSKSAKPSTRTRENSSSSSKTSKLSSRALENLAPPPWSAKPLNSEQVRGVYLEEWKKAKNRHSCAPLVLAGVEKEAGIRSRRANFYGGWAVAYDSAKVRSVFGIAGAGVDIDSPDDAVSETFPNLIRWSDGSVVSYGLRGGSGPGYLAYLGVAGQSCLYNIWSERGKEHLEHLLSTLRVVSNDILAAIPVIPEENQNR